jgi:hypothetical protein
MMNTLLVLLRLLHIVAAFAWVGLGAATAFFIVPAALSAGESGLRYLRSIFTRTPYGPIFGIVGGLTVLAGILLYLVGDAASHFSNTGNIVLGIGAAAGVLAAIHGGATTGRASSTLAASLEQYNLESGGTIPGGAMPVLQQQVGKLLTHSRVSMALMVIALLGMGSARYL